MPWSRKRIAWIAAGGVVTLLGTLVVLNLVPAQQRLEHRVERKYETGSDAYYRALGVLLGPTVLSGNRVQALQNGDEIFPSMLAAIQGAQRTITFETYIYWSGDDREAVRRRAGRARAQRRRVHVLLDWVGSQKIDDALVEEMRDAGVEIELYHPLSWYHVARINNRTHRKLLVVDGRIGFTGGVGIADKWGGQPQDPEHWRDSHYRVEGPVVAQMQAVFIDNWTKVSGQVLHGEEYFPALSRAGDMPRPDVLELTRRRR